MEAKTNDGKKGGTLKGPAHSEGGIKAVVVNDGRPVELEGGEVIINKHAAKKHWKTLSKINQSEGNGVPIKEPQFKSGGNIKVSTGVFGKHEFWRVTDGDKIGAFPKRLFTEEQAKSEFMKSLNDSELTQGIEVEKEHSETAKKLYNQEITPKEAPKSIAKEHLKEDPKYYTKLKKVEKHEVGGEVKNGFTLLDRELKPLEFFENKEEVVDYANTVAFYEREEDEAEFTTYAEAKRFLEQEGDYLVRPSTMKLLKKGGEINQEKVGIVMSEFKKGKLKTSYGKKVTDREQALAIALSEARTEKHEKGANVDLFEHHELIPSNVQKILDKHSQSFEDGDYKGLSKAHKELNKIGYTFEYYLDGQAYGLRPSNVEVNQLEGYEQYAKGKNVKKKKTDYTIAEFLDIQRQRLREHNAKAHEDDRLDWADWRSEIDNKEAKEYGIFFNMRMENSNGDRGVFEYMPENSNYKEDYQEGGDIENKNQKVQKMALGDLINKFNPPEKRPVPEIVSKTMDEGYALVNTDYLPQISQIDILKPYLEGFKHMNLGAKGWKFQFGTSRQWAGLCNVKPQGVFKSQDRNIFVSIEFTKGDTNWHKNMKDVILHEIAHAIVFEIFYFTNKSGVLNRIDPNHIAKEGHGVIWSEVCSAINGGIDCPRFYQNSKTNELFLKFKYTCLNCDHVGYGNVRMFATKCSKCFKPVITEANI